MGSSGFGIACVNGRSRSPRPPARMTAFMLRPTVPPSGHAGNRHWRGSSHPCPAPRSAWPTIRLAGHPDSSTALHPAEQNHGRGATAGAVAMVRPLVIVEAQEAVEGALELGQLGEVAAPELHPPVLVEDRALQTLDEAVGPSVTGLRLGVADPKLVAGLGEGTGELAAAVREHALDRPAGLAVGRDEDVAQEAGGGLGRRLRLDEDARRGVGAGGVAGGDLPDLAYALELADVEAVEADEFAGNLSLDVTLRAAATRPLKRAAGPLGEQPRLAAAVPRWARREPGRSESARHGPGPAVADPDAPRSAVDGGRRPRSGRRAASSGRRATARGRARDRRR